MRVFLVTSLVVILLGCTSKKTIDPPKAEANTINEISAPLAAWQFQGKQSNVEWHSFVTVSGKQTSVKIKAKIGEGWHLYSQHLESEMGPVATSFSSESTPEVIFSEKSEVHKSYDENFAMNVAYFEKEALFEAIIPTNSEEYSFVVSYMVCNDETCLPPVDQEIKITIP